MPTVVRLTAVLCIALAHSSAVGAASEDVAAASGVGSKAGVSRVSLRVTSAVSDAVIETVARLAEPSILEIPPGQSPEPLIRERCGAYTTAYERIFVETNPGIRLAPESERREVVLPACLRWTNKTSVPVMPGDTLESIVSREIGVSTEAVLIPCVEATKSSRCNRTARQLVEQLNPGVDFGSLKGISTVILPITTSWTTLTFTADNARKFGETELAPLPLDDEVKGDIQSRTQYLDAWLPRRGLTSEILSRSRSAISETLEKVFSAGENLAFPDLPATEAGAEALVRAAEMTEPVPAALAAAVNLTADPAILGSSPAPDEIDVVEPVDFEGAASTEDACREASKSVDWPVVIEDVKVAIATSVATARARSRYRSPGASVLIVDTGITRVNELFMERDLAKNDRERLDINGDNDGNRYKNDLFGINSEFGGDPTADMEYARHLHGTQVAALVLGGPLRGNIAELDGTIRLRFANVVKGMARLPSGERPFRVTVDGLSNAVSYAGSENLPVVNISIAASSPVVAVEDALRNYPHLLLVVAAGNRGNDLGITPAYPAAYGGALGHFSDQVITVAAQDLNGGIPAFSNRSADYVDVVAPGCDIIYVDKDGVKQRLFGTSFAAPLVSHTAGILWTLGLDKPLDIKNRILNSADYEHEKLNEAVSSLGRLNIAKAVYVYHDVLELTDGKTLRLGLWERSSKWFCKDTPQILTTRIRKISRVGIEPDIRLRYVYEDSQNNRKTMLCEPSGSGLTFNEQGTVSSEEVTWAAINDVVPAVFPPAM